MISLIAGNKTCNMTIGFSFANCLSHSFASNCLTLDPAWVPSWPNLALNRLQVSLSWSNVEPRWPQVGRKLYCRIVFRFLQEAIIIITIIIITRGTPGGHPRRVPTGGPQRVFTRILQEVLWGYPKGYAPGYPRRYPRGTSGGTPRPRAPREVGTIPVLICFCSIKAAVS